MRFWPTVPPSPHKKKQILFFTVTVLAFYIFQTFLKLGYNEGLLGGTLLLAEEMIYDLEKKIRGEQRTMPWQRLFNFLKEDFQRWKFSINSIWELRTTKHSNPSVCDRLNGASHLPLKAPNQFVFYFLFIINFQNKIYWIFRSSFYFRTECLLGPKEIAMGKTHFQKKKDKNHRQGS